MNHPEFLQESVRHVEELRMVHTQSELLGKHHSFETYLELLEHAASEYDKHRPQRSANNHSVHAAFTPHPFSPPSSLGEISESPIDIREREVTLPRLAQETTTTTTS